jgi:hypothetical protein
MIFVNVCSTWSIVELIEFWDMNNKKWRKWFKVGFTFLISNTYGLPVCTRGTKYPNQLLYNWLVLNRGWNRASQQIMIFENVCSTRSPVEFKKRFERWITRNKLNGVSLFNLTYLITLTAYLCSQWTPNVQIKCFMSDWTLYTLFVLNRGWKRDSFQIMMFVYICSKWNIIELKIRV